MISRWGVRARVMLVAVVPAIVLAAVMIAYYTHSRLGDLEAAYADRGRAFARQIATATEYAVFANNREDIRRLLATATGEEGVRGVLVAAPDGTVLASSGTLEPAPHRPLGGSQRIDLGATARFIEPIVPVRLSVDAPTFEEPGAPAAPPLGAVVLDMSNFRLEAQRSELLWTGAAVLMLVLVGSVLLAVRTSQGVSQPIRDVALSVQRIGAGRLDERVRVSGGGSLRRLAEGVNEMAARLQSAHQDMTQRIDEATAELRARKEAAERADVAKSRFLAAASHDLRQPMHALGLFIAELADQPHAPSTRRLVRQIAASAEAMGNLLDALLDISRLDAGALEASILPCPVQPILDRIANDFSIWAEERGLRLRVRPCRHWIRTDPMLFERVLSNLVSNAVRYTPSGTILLACRPCGERLRVEVRDSGIGIAPEAQEVVFHEFVQLDNPERARTKGLGLGLAIVRRLTQLLGHRLTLRSAPGRGSVFGIEVERSAPAAPAADARRHTAREPGSLQGVRVAVVDDDPLALVSLESLLASWGCEVTATASLLELMAALRSVGSPDVLISDYCLQGHETGLDVVAEVHAACGYRLYSILISGDTGSETRARARSAGLPLLHKPVRPAKLRALMQRMLSAEADGEEAT